MKVELKNVYANPFRNMERYPIHKQKILQLKNSIQSTEFWDNIVAREREGGGIEIAYGHHRLAAQPVRRHHQAREAHHHLLAHQHLFVNHRSLQNLPKPLYCPLG